ncbi:MAG TPA: hypothetical protein VGU02_05640 [Gaiellaceae bacterium]|nr:hypothetical protein [Gaiellaceae bacterium]
MHGQTITLQHVYLTSGSILTVVFGSRSGGGPGARAPSQPGPLLWRTTEASTAAGTLTPLR